MDSKIKFIFLILAKTMTWCIELCILHKFTLYKVILYYIHDFTFFSEDVDHMSISLSNKNFFLYNSFHTLFKNIMTNWNIMAYLAYGLCKILTWVLLGAYDHDIFEYRVL